MGNSPGICRKCRKQECIKNAKGFYHRIKNTPASHVLANRLLYITGQTVHLVLDELKGTFPDRPAFDILNVHTGICPWSVTDHKAGAILDKYSYCKEFNQAPDYDEAPVGWIQAVGVINSEKGLCYNAWKEVKVNAAKNLKGNGTFRGKESPQKRSSTSQG